MLKIFCVEKWCPLCVWDIYTGGKRNLSFFQFWENHVQIDFPKLISMTEVILQLKIMVIFLS